MPQQKRLSLTTSQQEFLKQNCKRMTIPEMAEILNITPSRLYQNLIAMGIYYKKNGKSRTPVEQKREGYFDVNQFTNWLL